MFDTSLLDEALKGQRERLERERADLLGRVVEALKAVRKAHGAREAYVIGSLLAEYGWRRDSDVDVAVGGCSGAVLDVMKALEDATGRVVDVVDLDRHPHPDAFRRKGLKVYG